MIKLQNFLKKLKTKVGIYSLALLMTTNICSCGKVNSNEKDENKILNDIEYTEFVDNCDNIVLHYNNDKFYLSNSEIQNIIKCYDNNKKCKYKFDNNINSIVTNIKNNSTDYINKNDNYINIFDDNYIDLEKILNNIVSHATNDINEDLCRIKDIKIVAVDENSNQMGFYDEKSNILKLNYGAIKKDAVSSGLTFEEKLNLVILHELNHSRQWSCCCKNNDDKILMYDDNFYSMIGESSAESELYNLNKVDIYDSNKFIYEKERSSESLLFLIGMFNEKSVDDYYNAIFDGDLKKFFDFFNVKTNDEIKTLYNVIYSVDSYYCRTSLGHELYDNNNSITYGDIIDGVGLTYRNDIFKMTLKNMVEYTVNHTDFSLEENIIMLEYVKNILTESLSFKISDNDFVNNFYSLNNCYIDFLCKHYSTSVDVIDDYVKQNSKYVLYNLENLSNNEPILYDNYSDIAKSLYGKFPIIKAITITNDYYEDNLFYFSNYNSTAYAKKK